MGWIAVDDGGFGYIEPDEAVVGGGDGFAVC